MALIVSKNLSPPSEIGKYLEFGIMLDKSKPISLEEIEFLKESTRIKKRGFIIKDFSLRIIQQVDQMEYFQRISNHYQYNLIGGIKIVLFHQLG